MSAKKIFTEEKEDVYFKDIKEKLSDVHISVIEVSQALQGRKLKEAKDKVSFYSFCYKACFGERLSSLSLAANFMMYMRSSSSSTFFSLD